MIILRICYIKETQETCDFVKRILIRIKRLFNIIEFCKDNEKTIIYLPMFKSNKIADKKMMKLAKKINKRLYDNDIENVVLSSYLEGNDILKQKLYCQNINILDGRYLFYLLIPETIEYILKRQKKKIESRRNHFINKRPYRKQYKNYYIYSSKCKKSKYCYKSYK